MNNTTDLNRNFGIDGHLEFRPGPGGLILAEIRNRAAAATLCLHGAHLMHYQPAGRDPVLWMSGRSEFSPDKPIRGGIPICWPWFGSHPDNPALPSHGFARLAEWTVLETRAEAPDRTAITLRLTDSEATRRYWPHAFVLTVAVVVGTALELRLETRNAGNESFVVSQALHTYFNVSRVTDIAIRGFDGCPCLDTVGGANRRGIQHGDIAIAAETDLVLFETAGPAEILDPGFSRRITIDTRGSRSAVVWNPWIDKAGRMPDFGNEEYPGMVCVETANALDDKREIAPGKSHVLGANIAVADLA